jgi:hypothetical protein
MSITLLKPAGSPGAESGKPTAHPHEPAQRSTAMYVQQQYLHAQELQRERLRQAEAQRLRRVALRARRSLAARLLA